MEVALSTEVGVVLGYPAYNPSLVQLAGSKLNIVTKANFNAKRSKDIQSVCQKMQDAISLGLIGLELRLGRRCRTALGKPDMIGNI